MTKNAFELAREAEPLVKRLASVCSSASHASQAHDMDRERWMDCFLGIAEEIIMVSHDLCVLMGVKPIGVHLDSVMEAVEGLDPKTCPPNLYRATDFAIRTALSFSLAVEDGIRGDAVDFEALAGFGDEALDCSDLALRWATRGTLRVKRSSGGLRFEFTDVGRTMNEMSPLKYV
ncbi:MAG: hypothetical protein VR70_04000 [Rhodospirillaceae bacterium BRH_c57]|nr:MAG: hypothetical protein VR70_04000 [Rhodospirillaceae bacterium BRH_c57]